MGKEDSSFTTESVDQDTVAQERGNETEVCEPENKRNISVTQNDTLYHSVNMDDNSSSECEEEKENVVNDAQNKITSEMEAAEAEDEITSDAGAVEDPEDQEEAEAEEEMEVDPEVKEDKDEVELEQNVGVEEELGESKDKESCLSPTAKHTGSDLELAENTSHLDICRDSLLTKTPVAFQRRSTRRSTRISGCLDFSLTPMTTKLRPRTPCSRSTRRSLTAHTDFMPDSLMTPRTRTSVRRSTRRSTAKKLRNSDVRDLPIPLNFEDQLEDSVNKGTEITALNRTGLEEENIIREEEEEETSADKEAVPVEGEGKGTPIPDVMATPSTGK